MAFTFGTSAQTTKDSLSNTKKKTITLASTPEQSSQTVSLSSSHTKPTSLPDKKTTEGMFGCPTGDTIFTTPRSRFFDADLIENHDWFRSIGDTRSRVRGLYLTTGNFEEFCLSFVDDEAAREFIDRIFQAMGLPMRVSGKSVLDLLEGHWTGTGDTKAQDLAFTVFARIQVSYFISTSAEIVTEICYLAVAEELLDSLIAFATPQDGLVSLWRMLHIVGGTSITALCEQLRQQSINTNFELALDRSIFDVNSRQLFEPLSFTELWPCRDAPKIPGFEAAGNVSTIVSGVLSMFTVGRRTFENSFVRSSDQTAHRPLRPDSTLFGSRNIRIVSNKQSSNICVFLCSVPHRYKEKMTGHGFYSCLTEMKSIEFVQLNGKYKETFGGAEHSSVQHLLELSTMQISPPGGSYSDPTYPRDCQACLVFEML